jgi:osmotically-inducible protein OsmY
MIQRPEMIQTADQQITTAAAAVLANNSVRELRQLRVDHSNNKLHLSGRVRSFYHKQLAQEAVRAVAAGLTVVNRVDVGS